MLYAESEAAAWLQDGAGVPRQVRRQAVRFWAAVADADHHLSHTLRGLAQLRHWEPVVRLLRRHRCCWQVQGVGAERGREQLHRSVLLQVLAGGLILTCSSMFRPGKMQQRRPVSPQSTPSPPCSLNACAGDWHCWTAVGRLRWLQLADLRDNLSSAAHPAAGH